MNAASPYDAVAMTTPVTVPYQRYSDRPADWFAGRCLRRMLEDAGLAKSEIDGLAAASFTMGPDTSVALTATFGISPRWLEWIPMGGASGIVAARRAARAIQSGEAEIVACIGADTNKKGGFRDLLTGFSRASTDAVYPYGAGGPNTVFSMITHRYMEEYGIAREAFGRLCISQRRNARHFPHALLRDDLDLDVYLGSRPVAEPLHLFDCVMPCAGAEGFLVMSTDRARSLGLRYAGIAGAIERHNAYADDDIPLRGGWRMDRDALYAQADCAPEEIDLVQTYDDYPVASFIQLEDLGFCEQGGAASLFSGDEMSLDAQRLVHNSSGGQLSCGQAGAAGGFLGIVEAVRQVTGAALGNPVRTARRALVSGYGMVVFDRCLCSAAIILESPNE